MGWQRQDHGPSVQQAIEDAAFAVTGEKVVVHAAGRTDAGVHGLGMRAHLEIVREIVPGDGAFNVDTAVFSDLREAYLGV